MEPGDWLEGAAGTRRETQSDQAETNQTESDQAESNDAEGGEEAVRTGFALTLAVVVGIVLYRLVWADRRERQRQYPKRVK